MCVCWFSISAAACCKSLLLTATVTSKLTAGRIPKNILATVLYTVSGYLLQLYVKMLTVNSWGSKFIQHVISYAVELIFLRRRGLDGFRDRFSQNRIIWVIVWTFLQPLTATHLREFLAHFVRTKPGVVTTQTWTLKQINAKFQHTAVSLQNAVLKFVSVVVTLKFQHFLSFTLFCTVLFTTT